MTICMAASSRQCPTIRLAEVRRVMNCAIQFQILSTLIIIREIVRPGCDLVHTANLFPTHQPSRTRADGKSAINR
jgi:hypothetical protein